MVNLSKSNKENLSKSNKENLEFMNGCECLSLNYEGCVYIKGDKVLMNGEQIDTLNTDKKVKRLWNEYVKGEGF